MQSSWYMEQKCQKEGCVSIAKRIRRGLCEKHYYAAVSGKCKIEGCISVGHKITRGLCQNHIREEKRGGRPRLKTGPKPKPKKPCTFPGCLEPAKAKTLCGEHYHQALYADKLLKATGKAPRVPGPKRLCIVEGCDRYAFDKELCRRHAVLLNRGKAKEVRRPILKPKEETWKPTPKPKPTPKIQADERIAENRKKREIFKKKCIIENCENFVAKKRNVRCPLHAKANRDQKSAEKSSGQQASLFKLADPALRADLAAELADYSLFILSVARRNTAKYNSRTLMDSEAIGRTGFGFDDLVQELTIFAWQVLVNFDPAKCPVGKTKKDHVHGAIVNKMKGIASDMHSPKRGLFERHENVYTQDFQGNYEDEL